MQVEIFWSESVDYLQDMINKFIGSIPKSQIIDIKYGHSEGCNSAMVIYKT